MSNQKLVAIGIKRSGHPSWQICQEQEFLNKETVEAHKEDDPLFMEKAEADLTKEVE